VSRCEWKRLCRSFSWFLILLLFLFLQESFSEAEQKPRRILIGVNYCLRSSDLTAVGMVCPSPGIFVESKPRDAVVKLNLSGPPLRLILRFLVVENGERCERAFHRQKTKTPTARKRLNSGIGWARMMEAIIDLMQLKGGCVFSHRR
jgi:hypothetical protein